MRENHINFNPQVDLNYYVDCVDGIMGIFTYPNSPNCENYVQRVLCISIILQKTVRNFL